MEPVTIITLVKSDVKKILMGGLFSQSGNVIAVTSWIKCIVSNNEMTITSTNEENQIQVKLALSKPCDNCEFCVAFNDIKDALRLINDDEFTIEINEEGKTAEIIHKRGKMRFPIYDITNFPVASNEEISDSFTIDSSNLFSMINKAIKYCDKDATRPTLSGVNMIARYNPDKDCTVFYMGSSNGNYLYIDKIKLIENVVIDANVILSSHSFSSVASMLSNAEDVIINISERHVFFSIGEDIEISCRRIDGTFPTLPKVLPKEIEHTITVNVAELTSALKRLLLSSSASYVFEAEFGSTLKLTARNLENAKYGIEEIPCNCDVPIKIGLNLNFLLLVLSSISTKSVIIKIAKENQLVTFYEDNETENKKQVLGLMPCKLFY